jgi:thioredoxin 1
MMYKILVMGAALFFCGGCSSERDMPMLEVTSYEAVEPLIARGKPVLLELGSTTCGGCRDMAHSLYHIKQEHPESAIYFVDIRNERYVARQYGVRMMPTQVILDGAGREVDRHIGVAGTSELTAKLRRFGVIEAR